MKKKPSIPKAPPVLPENIEELKAYTLKLHAQLEERTQQRNNLSEECQKLASELDTMRDATAARREQELHDLRIRQRWRRVTGIYNQQVKQLLSELPLPVDTSVFESDDWERLSQVKSLTQQLQNELERLQKFAFIEAM